MQAGVRPGQQVLSVSDPIRFRETWQLNEMVSLRYIKDAIRMRRSETIQLSFSRGTLPGWQPTSAGQGQASTPMPASVFDWPLDDAAASGGSFDEAPQMLLGGEGQEAKGLTMAGKLERSYKEKAAAQRRQATVVEGRIKRRQEYMDQVAERNDTPFFAGLFLLFVLPAAGILLWAVSSGYLDKLSAGYGY
jgi:hypothetical protein